MERRSSSEEHTRNKDRAKLMKLCSRKRAASASYLVLVLVLGLGLLGVAAM